MLDPRLIEAAETLIRRHARSDHVPLIGISGAQGSGKTTLAQAMAERWGSVQLSLDDVYLDQPERQRLAQTIHPLLALRGPPLTHDLELLAEAVRRLRKAGPETLTPLPVFDKRTDRRLVDHVKVCHGRPRVILVDGWCLGARPQTDAALQAPVNSIERDQDGDGTWRRAVNAALAGAYRETFVAFDAILFIAAPSFDVVEGWRCEQETQTLSVSDLTAEDRARIAAFIRIFERITRSMLDGGVIADVIVSLDDKRAVTSVRAGSRGLDRQ